MQFACSVSCGLVLSFDCLLRYALFGCVIRSHDFAYFVRLFCCFQHISFVNLYFDRFSYSEYSDVRMHYIHVHQIETVITELALIKLKKNQRENSRRQ